MILKNKKKGNKINVVSHRNKILLNAHGFVMLTGKTLHYSSETVRPDIIEADYHIPAGVTIGE